MAPAAPPSGPSSWPERLSALRGGTLDVVAPRPAATVMLLRDEPGPPAAPARLAVHLIRRRATMAFAAGMYAFPGGRVDPADGAVPDDPATLRAAAVREVEEETGVRLDPTALRPWARWITPEFEARRYDTWFFTAALPPGQEPGSDSPEADLTVWMTPDAAVRGHDRGRLAMLPPTLTALRELRPHRTVAEVERAARERESTAAVPVVPEGVLLPDGRLELTWSGPTPGRWSPHPASAHGYPDPRPSGPSTRRAPSAQRAPSTQRPPRSRG